MPRARSDQVMVAADSASFEVNGTPYTIHRDLTRARASHPIVKANPHLWKPLEIHYDVEQTTAAPGEKRGSVGS